jgi:hypothetical protein
VKPFWIIGIAVAAALCLPAGVRAGGAELVVERRAGETALRVGSGEPFRVTDHRVASARLLELAGGETRVVTWTETDPRGDVVPFYALGLRGEPVGRARTTSYRLQLNHGEFDPLVEPAPEVRPALAAGPEASLYLVQFVTQPIRDYRRALARLGAEVRHFVPHHALVVEMSPEVRSRVARLEFVRWVGPYHPAYRVERALRADAETLQRRFPRQRYSLLLFDPDAAPRASLARRIEAIGGRVDDVRAGKLLMEATLTPAQLVRVAGWDEIAYVDRWSPLEADMDLVREAGGANHVEAVAGYTGDGVRGEVFDVGFNLEHPDFASRPPIEHGPEVGLDSHGTACLGILFGDGSGDARARGLLPAGQPIAADANKIDLGGQERYDHTAELKEPPYNAVFQSASVGSARTTEYTTVSAEHDAMLFDHDLLHCQSQSNAGTRASRPQAWAKNVVSGGGILHYDTADTGDDCWCGSASIGPAADGRIKPDLVFYYDDVYTTHSVFDDYGNFGGTSASTPSICGHFGLLFEMWADGIFGNDVDPAGSVFDNRPHMTTAKALIINTADPYPFSGRNADMARVHQGWGVPDVQALYDLRDEISFVDESVLLENTERAVFNTWVEGGAHPLKVTLTYADPAGNPAASIHRINDLTVKVTSPSGTVYWGNHGLLEGNWSRPDGDPDTIDTVENVFVESPESGLWLVEVIASELIEDGHVETPELDADFALVVSGGSIEACRDDGVVSLDRPAYTCQDRASVRVVDCGPNLDPQEVDAITVTVDSDSEPEGELLELTETGPDTATFSGTLPLDESDGPGTLWVADQDTVTAVYVDADDGQGGSDVPKTDSAPIDCTAPEISGVQTTEVGGHFATVSFDTDETARGTVRYGVTCSGLTGVQREPEFGTAHAVTLNGLQEATSYVYRAEAVDRAGNTGIDDNGGACYPLTTEALPEPFTEQFKGDNDTGGLRFGFTPDGSVDAYRGCTEPAASFGTDPSGGEPLTLADDDSVEVVLDGGETVSLYGASYGSFFVGSNGYVTFGSGDDEFGESLTNHFELPRVSALFDDLDPSAAGTVSWKQTDDRAAVTYQDVPELGDAAGNDFQIELFFDGRIAMTLLDVQASDGITGLSEGLGIPPEFEETDLSAMPSCAGGAANVPGEAGRAPMLTVTGYDESTGVLSLSYGVPCQASGHVIEYGELSPAAIASYAWTGQECGLDASGTHAWDTSTADHEMLFFVVVAHNGTEEGSYGRAGDGSERPEDATSTGCQYVQDLANACE